MAVKIQICIIHLPTQNICHVLSIYFNQIFGGQYERDNTKEEMHHIVNQYKT